MAKEEKKAAQKKKAPTALKRIKQDKKKNLRNRSFKSKVKTALRASETAISSKSDTASSALNLVYSLMDKGVKLGVFKKNKAARTKQRMASKLKTA